MQDMLIDGGPLHICEHGNRPAASCRVAIDSGTSLFTGPSSAVRHLTRRLHAVMAATGVKRGMDDTNLADAGGCDLSALPTLSIAMGGHTFELQPVDYILHTGEAHANAAAADSFGGDCALAFVGMDVPPPRGPLWVFGDIFMRKYATIFDRDANRIGFALAASGEWPSGRMSTDAAALGSSGGRTTQEAYTLIEGTHSGASTDSAQAKLAVSSAVPPERRREGRQDHQQATRSLQPTKLAEALEILF